MQTAVSTLGKGDNFYSGANCCKKEKTVSNSSITMCKHCLQSTKYTCTSLVVDSDKVLSQQLYKGMPGDLNTL